MPTKPSLQARIKAEAAKAAPTLVPVSDTPVILPPPEKEEEAIPQLSELVKDRRNRLEAARLMQELGQTNNEISALTKKKKPLQASVKAFVSQLGVRQVQSGEWVATYYSSPRKSLKEAKLRAALLKRGMQPSDISKIVAESSDVSEGYTLRVRAIGAEEEEE